MMMINARDRLKETLEELEDIYYSLKRDYLNISPLELDTVGIFLQDYLSEYEEDENNFKFMYETLDRIENINTLDKLNSALMVRIRILKRLNSNIKSSGNAIRHLSSDIYID